MSLKQCVEKKMEEMIEEMINQIQELNNQDPEDWMNTYMEETFNSHIDWYDFDQSELTIFNMDELLECYNENQTNEILSVNYLLQQYGYWTSSSLKEKYLNLLKERLSVL